MPKVSVIIPTYNYAHYISDAIDSVLSQTYKDFEIIVVDDGSTDNTREVLSNYGNKIKYIYQENKGPAAARNTGIKASGGEYLQFLDSDDYISTEKLKKQSRILDAYPDVGWTYCDCVYRDEAGNVLRKLSDISNNPPPIISGQLRTKEGWPPEGMIFPFILLKNFLPVNAVLMRRDCLKIGFFDESLSAFEDNDFWMRLSSKERAKYLNEPLAFIRVHKVQTGEDVLKSHVNRLKVFEKICRMFPTLVKPHLKEVNKIMTDSYNQIGYEHYRNCRYREAVHALKNSVKRYPFQKKAYFYLFMSLIKMQR